MNTTKHIPFDLEAFDIKSKTAFVAKISYVLLNLSLRLLQICSKAKAT